MQSFSAIDIGSTKTVSVIADFDERSGTRVVAVGLSACNGIKKGKVVDIDQTANSVVNSVRQCEQMAGRKISGVIVSVSGEHIIGQNSRGIIPIVPSGRIITREDVNRVINHSKQIALPADRELIHALPRSFRVDGQDGIHRPFGMSGERLEVSTHLVSAQINQIQNLERCVNRAQIEVDYVVFSPVASALSTLTQEEISSGVLLLDIGGGTTDIALYINGALEMTAVVPIGSKHVTSDISQLLKTTIDGAENLKINQGLCIPDDIEDEEMVYVEQVGQQQEKPFPKKVFAEIIHARVNELFKLIKQTVSGWGVEQDVISRIVLTGGGSKISGIQKLAEKVFNDTPTRVASPENLGGLSDMIKGPEYATVVGLLKYGIRQREQESVVAESGDWKRFLAPLRGLFSAKGRAE